MRKIASSPRKSKRNQNQKRSKTPKTVYRVKNWATYDEALKQRGSLTVWFSKDAIKQWKYDGPPQRGAQFQYSDLAIETAMNTAPKRRVKTLLLTWLDRLIAVQTSG